jgi:hypothetical protein
LNSDSTIIKEGWLWKQGNERKINRSKTKNDLGARVRGWKRRWFVLTDACLCYYESRTVNNPLLFFLSH